MPPRTRSLRDLTDDELEELASLEPLTSSAPVPRLPASSAAPSSRMEVGEIQLLGQGADDAWLDELIGRPEPTPAQRPTLSATGPGATFDGEDTPEARELVKQRGMRLTSPPSDEDLLAGLTSERPATMPELDDGDALDELIRAEGAAMDREQSSAAARDAAPARKSREDAVRESLQAPTRAQGGLALLFDALLGTKTLDDVHARQRGYEGAMAQARMQDVAAGERSDERSAARALDDARLGVTMRGQDLTDARAAEARAAADRRAEQADKRIREEGALGRDAARERARIMAEGRARNEAPVLSPDQERAGLAGYLSEQANTSEAEAASYLSGKTEGIAPGKLERLRGTDSQLKMLPPAQRATVIAQGLGRAGADRDRKEPEKLEARTALLTQHRVIDEASKAWAKMSAKDKRVLATIGGGDSWLASTARDAGLSEEGQVQAASIQALADALIKAQSGASVTANEWRRVATELGLPKDAFSPFNSPASIGAWLQKSRDGFRQVRDSTLSTYRDLFDDVEAP